MKTITIYTTPTCGFCKALKQFLKDHQVTYSEHDVTTDEQALSEMQSLSGGGMQVPFIVFNKSLPDQSIQTGFDAGKVSKALSL